MQIESDEGCEQSGDDGERSSTSADRAGGERVADDDITLNSDSDDEPHRVVTDSVQRRRGQLARPLRHCLHV